MYIVLVASPLKRMGRILACTCRDGIAEHRGTSTSVLDNPLSKQVGQYTCSIHASNRSGRIAVTTEVVKHPKKSAASFDDASTRSFRLPIKRMQSRESS